MAIDDVNTNRRDTNYNKYSDMVTDCCLIILVINIFIVIILDVSTNCFMKPKQHYSDVCIIFQPYTYNPPEYLDWREYGAVTPVKKARYLTSHESDAGAIESAWFISKGELNNVTETFQSYKQGIKKQLNNNMYINSCGKIQTNNQHELQLAVAMSPVSVILDIDMIYNDYKSGDIITSCTVSSFKHFGLIVGYEKDYWIVKHYLGENWGSNGYVKYLKTNTTNGESPCGIAKHATIPIIEESYSYSIPLDVRQF